MSHVDTLIKLALEEDIGDGDITSEAIIDASSTSKATISAKEEIVLAGIYAARGVFEMLDPDVKWTSCKENGDICKRGETIARLEGKTTSLLKGERTALNFLQHLSGIATLTRKYVDVLRDTNIQLLDTRKTTPGYRHLERLAVKLGGGTNHRMGLFDHFLIKNNHISAAGSISKALSLAHKKRKPGQKIEIETRTLKEVEEAIQGKPDIVMLDNMSPADVKAAVAIIGDAAKTEVSGNMTLAKLKDYIDTGIDYISVGAITHSAPAADIHMEIDLQ